MGYTTAVEFDQAYEAVRAAFASGATKAKAWRRMQLKRAWWMIEDNKDRICAALHTDLHKHRQEALLSDCSTIQADILHALEKLDEWMSDERPAKSNVINRLGNATVRKEPLGVSLIIGAWNLPFVLLLQPMIGAIAAGCSMVLKPSELASASQDLLMEIVPKYLDQKAIRCVTAGPEEMAYILDHRFDHIFYTGSAKIAKVIHAAAAKHLTPVTLELGGQNPAIVTRSADIELTSKHIAATKFTNAGQICLNTNHILVDPTVREALVKRLGEHFDKFKGGKDAESDHYTYIINDRHFDRLEDLLKNTSGKIAYGGGRDPKTRYFAPTIVVDVKAGDALLSEEIFGPILPIVDADIGAAINFTNNLEHPLAIYAFTSDPAEKTRILNQTQSGGVTFNDCALHAAAVDAPFGGVGNSGQGYAHGYYGFLTFTHLRTYIDALPKFMENLLEARYPPYTDEKIAQLVPPVKPPFDREGNDVKTRGGIAALASGILGLVKGK